MTLPTLLFGFLLSTLYGTAFHLWRGGGAGRFLLYLILSWVGFWLGNFIGDQVGFSFFKMGALNLGLATLTSFIFLAAGYWLSRVDLKQT